jgi:hypothetical protein
MFGDSYSTPGYCVQPIDSFWGLATVFLRAKSVENYSWPGNSFDSICHMLISLQLQIDWKNDFLLIGIPPLERYTVFDNFKDTKYYSNVIEVDNWSVEQKEIRCHNGLEQIKYSEVKDLVIFQDRSWTETQILRSLFLLTSWLDSINANYLILNLSKPLDPDNKWGPSEFLLPYCINHNRCIVFDNTYYSVNLNINKPLDFDMGGWYGHHGPAGNRLYFEQALRQKLC